MGRGFLNVQHAHRDTNLQGQDQPLTRLAEMADQAAIV